MDIEDDDDFYAPEEPTVPTEEKDQPSKADELEEGEEEDEGAAMDEDEDDDSDIDIITERKDGTTAAPPSQSKYSDIRNIPQRTTSDDPSAKSAPVKKEGATRSSVANIGTPSADKTSEAASKSTIDINANPIYPAAGKPITHVNIDEDLPENEKPWRKPGTDISDYFNYGFDEFTWALYAAKQDNVRGEYGADAFANSSKKMMEEMNSMMMMGGMGNMGGNAAAGGGGAGGGGVSGMPGMEGMPPEMQQMMQQMMGSGMDGSQMDPAQMAAMFSGAGASAGGQGQNFGAGGYGGNQGGYGFDQQNMGGGGGGGRGGFSRGRRGRW
ncbi:unnamed protein product [Clonostachys rosea]|uniref:Pre-mRNA polyadenylation factor Fip1 domain-containing protein n=1 Tax=Bionectria ochroleuca TaxID=29856 RepID=A0ABY6TNG0_BIOOC|nr:unnamed protein product [Clonostachys rosea]